MRRERVKKRIIPKGILFGLVAAVCVMAVYFAVSVYNSPESGAAGNYTFNTASEFAGYVNGTDALHPYDPDDTIELSLSSGLAFDLTSGFNGLGTSSQPFNGKIVIADNAIDVLMLNTALFNYVTTDAKIVNAQDSDRGITIIRTDAVSDMPLFAQHVVEGADNSGSDWRVTYSEDYITDATNHDIYDFSGVIGDIADNCKVGVTFINNSLNTADNSYRANVTGSGNLGLLCGTMGDSAELTVNSITGNNTDFNITSSGGNAGGIVGSMGDGATIKLGADYTSIANVTASSGGKYAGGLAGYAVNAELDPNGYTATVTKTLSGNNSSGGAGGMFGYYSSTTDNGTGADAGKRVFDLSSFLSDSNFTITGGRDAGGVIGKLEATNDIVITSGETFFAGDGKTNSFDRRVNLNGGTNRGGLIGAYSNSLLADTIEIKNIKVCASTNSGGGGIIGKIIDTAGPGNYVHIYDVAVKCSGGTLSAGLIADMGSKGSFLDISGKIAATGNFGSGFVSYQRSGVVRIAGYSDFGGGYFGTAANITENGTSGQLVGTRGNGLVYAFGTGQDTLTGEVSSGWTFRRSGKKADDIGDWGEALRVTSATESNYFTVDNSAHTVTVKAPVTSMGTITDFVKTALNIQHNVSGQPAEGALLFADPSNTSTVLLGSNLSITDDIDLAGTGIVALTRDDGTNTAYSGTFEGNNHTITLAIGEAYGLTAGGGAVSNGNNGYGTIIRHRFQGLLAKTGGATIKNLTIAGYDNTTASGATDSFATYIGGICAQSQGSITLSNVTTEQIDNVYATAHVKCGGAIGNIENGATGTVSISGSTFKTAINDERANDDSNKYFGGVIGYVDSKGAQTFNVSGVILDGTYSKTNTRGGMIYYGGLIGVFASASTNAASNVRNVNITDLTVGEHVNISAVDKSTSGRSSGAGAFIGSVWPNVNVTIGTAGSTDGITIGGTSDGSSKPTISVLSGSTNGNVGALFYKATGKMLVNHVDVVEADIKTVIGGSTFGFIVNDGYYKKDSDNSALYLNVDSAKYDIAATSFTGNYDTVFDEIVAFSKVPDTQIDDNGQAIISVTLPSNAPVVMTGSACNTYQNQTSYSKKINLNTRYYYNLESIRTKGSPTSAEKLLMWSVNKYAHSTVRGLFTNGFGSVISGNCDMTGLSYYPVDSSNMIINSGTTIKFYNKEIEDGESASGDTDSSARSTRNNGSGMTQHYLMHEAIFRNYTGTLTVNGLTVQGNVSNANGSSGFIIREMLGDQANSTTTATLKNIVLDGAYVDGSGYAPMLINKVGKNTSMTINGLTTDDSDDALKEGNAASSLIGDVGYDTATNISLNFSHVVLDARTGALADGTADSALDTAYGTQKSIFRRATFLNSFAFLSGGVGIYNYNHDEDWSAPLHQVTYGKEITTSTEYADKQKHYYDDDTNFTSPVSGSAGSEFDFSSGFLPHVYNGAELSLSNAHEIRVNVREATLTTGCGQYNDPYIIENGGQLVTAASIISGVEIDDIEVSLPSDLGTAANIMWHDSSTETDRVYTYKTVGGTKKFYAGSGNEYSYTLEEVRTYLTGAYYSLNNEITLPAGFVGFGAIKTGGWTSTNYECQYAFRGVIVGNGCAINNASGVPLIYSANGCVVRNLTVNVVSSVSISQSQLHSNLTAFNYDNTGCGAYGGIIGRVLGGDNIISKVGVDFDDAECSFSVTGTNSYDRLVPVGGYVGVLVSGGVIFRDMGTVAKKTGLTGTHYAKVDDSGYLYVNPIIGRIIAGYAFTESSAYHYDDTSATMKNGTKSSGGIPDLYPGNADKLNVTASAAGNHVITIPDAQAFYILSCIVNSGAGSAAYNAGTEQNYASISNAPWIAYRNYASTRCAAYDEVGTSAAVDGDYAKVAEGDKYSGSAKIPYIIRQYTTKNGSTYKARSICGNGNNPAVDTINLASSVTYEMAGGYSGIGAIYVDNNAFKLRFKKLDGKGSTVNLRMNHVEYNHESGNQNTKSNTQIDNYIPYTNAGYGLFNSMWHHSASETNCIKDIILSGNVFYDMIKLSDGSNIKYAYGWHNYNNLTGYYPNVADRIEATNILHTGSLAGLNGNSTYLKNVTIDTIDVEGAKYSGGMIGYTKGNKVSIISPVTSSLKVTAGFCAGGLIGAFYDSNDLEIKGTSENPVTIYINSIKVKGEPSCAKLTFNEFDKMYHSGGGLCGYLGTGASKKATVEYVTISGGTLTAPNRTKRPHDLRYKIAMGGLFGLARSSKVDVKHCNVTNVSIDGNLSGGLIGYFDGVVNGVIDDVMVSGSTINSENISGGLIAFCWASSSPSFTISDATVSGCSIAQVNNEAERACAGGLYGYVYISSWSSGCFDLYNIKVDSCTVSRANTVNKTDLEQCGVGGIYGVLRSTVGVSTGHNILLNNVSVSTSGNRIPGMIIGTNTDNSQLKLVGVSLQNGTATTVNPVGVFKSANGKYGTNGYVVYSDYFGASVPNTGQTQNTSDSSLNGSSNMLSGVTDYAAASPYVTINTSIDIADGTMKLTSDGMADTVAHLAVKNIYDANANLPYDISKTVRPTFAPYISKLSTYNNEQAATLDNDFAVLVLDDVVKLRSTAMINSYLQMVTNTGFDYATDNNSIYKIVLKRMNLEGDTFTVDTTNPCNLKRSASRFYMNANDVDTAGQMFSLIDVQYLDPRDTTKVAYHLYVPVIVKKILKYDFEVATGSGTNYESAWYDAQNRWGKPVMENSGTPVSIFFKYKYLRSQTEWQYAIDNGENLLRNYDKSLNMTKPDSISHIHSDTILVLVDKNNNGKPYYARFSEVYNSSTGVLNLMNFKEELDNNSSASFEPAVLNSMLDITASAGGSGNYVTCSEGEATIKAKLSGVETFFKLAPEDYEGTTYALTVNNINDISGNVPMEESYYISFFTEPEDSAVVYHYTFSGPTSFGDSSFPSRINNLNASESTAHMILGNIFEQSNISVSATNSNEAMSNANDTLTVTMSSDIAIRSSLKNEVQGYLNGANDSISVYQNFLIYLTRKDYDNPIGNKIIQGSPVGTGKYSISSANGSISAINNQAYTSVNVTHNYADFINEEDLRLFLTTGNGAHVSATMKLNYTSDIAIREQFPGKNNEADTGVGVAVSGSSNVAFDPNKAAFSKIMILGNDTYNRLYYSKESSKAKLTYFADEGEYGDYSILGINPWELVDNDEVTIDTLGVLDVSNIRDDAADYDTLVCRVNLKTRNNDYANKLVISDYISNMWLEGVEGVTSTTTAGTTEYTFSVPKAAVVDSVDSDKFIIPLNYTVKTGNLLENAGNFYSNYKVTLGVELQKSSNGAVCTNSQCSEYIVYTNAKVYPDYLD